MNCAMVPTKQYATQPTPGPFFSLSCYHRIIYYNYTLHLQELYDLKLYSYTNGCFHYGPIQGFCHRNQEYISFITTMIVKDNWTERYVVPPPPPLFLDYLSLSFINIFLLHISGHSEVCHFTSFLLSNQHITSRKVSVNDLRKHWSESKN